MSDPLAELRRQRRDSLATKIIFFVFLSTFVTAVVVSWISLRSSYTFVRQQIEEGFPERAERGAARVEQLLLATRGGLEGAARSRPLTRALGARAGEEARRRRVEAVLGQLLPGLAGVEAVWVIDGRGRVLAAAGAAPLPAAGDEHPPPSEEPGVRVAGPAERPGLAVAAPIPAASRKQPAGFLEGRLATTSLALALGGDGRGPEADVLLVGAEGQILAAARGPLPSPELRLPSPAPGPAAPSGVHPLRDDDGRQWFAAVHPLAGGAAEVVVQQPAEAALAPVGHMLTRIVVIDLAIVLLFSFLAYEITAAMLRPIELLYEGARRVSQGDLEVEIPVPDSSDEIALLTQNFNDMTQRLAKNRSELETAYARVREQNEELQRANEVLAQLSITDGLTKLHNHRYFQDHLTREIKRVRRTGEPLTMLLIDIDDFKSLNDRLGHAAGDELLVSIARILNDSVRETDLLARYGGEEFVVLATGTDRDGALALAEKIRMAVAEASFILDDGMRPIRVTVSIGVARFGGSRKAFFHAADRALYRAKAEGKNCVIVADDEG